MTDLSINCFELCDGLYLYQKKVYSNNKLKSVQYEAESLMERAFNITVDFDESENVSVRNNGKVGLSNSLVAVVEPFQRKEIGELKLAGRFNQSQLNISISMCPVEPERSNDELRSLVALNQSIMENLLNLARTKSYQNELKAGNVMFVDIEFPPNANAIVCSAKNKHRIGSSDQGCEINDAEIIRVSTTHIAAEKLLLLPITFRRSRDLLTKNHDDTSIINFPSYNYDDYSQYYYIGKSYDDINVCRCRNWYLLYYLSGTCGVRGGILDDSSFLAVIGVLSLFPHLIKV